MNARPVRILGAWWLILSLLTPFYHPYARLWLPLHAAGWLLITGLIVEIGLILNANGRWITELPRPFWAALLMCCVAGLVQVFVADPHAFRPGWVFEPPPSFRAFVDEQFALRVNRRMVQSQPLRILARRPLAYYLLLQGRFAVRLEPGHESLLSQPLPGERLVLDQAVLGPEGPAIVAKMLHFWKLDATYHEQLDPVTLLDVHPDSAYALVPDRENKVWLFSARSLSEGPQ